MQRYFDVVQNRQGTAVVGATVTVFDANGNLATLYSSPNNAPTSNPVYTNMDGEYAFYAVNGTYTLQITATNYATETKPGVVLFDPSDSSASNNVQFLQAGTGAQVRSVQSKLRDVVSVKDFGAVGDGVADDTAAIQAAIDYCGPNQKTVYFPSGSYKITNTLNVATKWDFLGDGPKSIIFTTNNQIALFTFAINTNTVDFWSMRNFVAQGPLTTNTNSCAFRFVGDNISFVQHGFCDVFVYGFGSAIKDEKLPRSTATGLEAMLNWNRWQMTLLNQGYAGYWGTKGSGTGNLWNLIASLNGVAAAVLKFGGTGCVVGDILASGHWGGGPNGIGIEIENNTVYRAQISLSGVQFDAGITDPVKFGSVGTTKYTNILLQSNNWGGGTNLGQNIQPLRASIVDDRDVSRWESGNAFDSAATTSTTKNIFDITFNAWGAANVQIVVTSLIGGVGVGVAVAEFDVIESTGALSITSISNRLTGNAACANISISSSGVTATVSTSFTPISSPSDIQATIVARGKDFKITRL